MGKSNEEIKAEMDAAALEAAPELEVIFQNQDSIQDLANWMARWYKSAGYNRLGRMLVAKAK